MARDPELQQFAAATLLRLVGGQSGTAHIQTTVCTPCQHLTLVLHFVCEFSEPPPTATTSSPADPHTPIVVPAPLFVVPAQAGTSPYATTSACHPAAPHRHTGESRYPEGARAGRRHQPLAHPPLPARPRVIPAKAGTGEAI